MSRDVSYCITTCTRYRQISIISYGRCRKLPGSNPLRTNLKHTLWKDEGVRTIYTGGVIHATTLTTKLTTTSIQFDHFQVRLVYRISYVCVLDVVDRYIVWSTRESVRDKKWTNIFYTFSPN